MAKVIARLTVTRALGNLTIIEINDNASFHSFYKIYTQVGRRRSTKTLVRTASRNEGLKPYAAMQPGLETLAAQWLRMSNVSSARIRIIRKRAYRKLLAASPDQLGTTSSKVNLPMHRFSPQRGIPVQLPEMVHA